MNNDLRFTDEYNSLNDISLNNRKACFPLGEFIRAKRLFRRQMRCRQREKSLRVNNFAKWKTGLNQNFPKN
jgi:hypothetical protein